MKDKGMEDVGKVLGTREDQGLAWEVEEHALARSALEVARAFQRGGAMWCVCPEVSGHAHHVAVEFMHPVIVGKRALPAFAISEGSFVDALENVVREGDVVVLLARAGDRTAFEISKRSQAWKALSVWIGAGQDGLTRDPEDLVSLDFREGIQPESEEFFGPRLGSGQDRSVEDPRGVANFFIGLRGSWFQCLHDGSLVMTYHLLWELTHVCLEHPGLLEMKEECEGPTCITCGDEGRVAEFLGEVEGAALGGGGELGVLEILKEGLVRSGDRVERVDMGLFPRLEPGQLVLVHAGTVIGTLQ